MLAYVNLVWKTYATDACGFEPVDALGFAVQCHRTRDKMLLDLAYHIKLTALG